MYIRLMTNINIIPSKREVTIRKGWFWLFGFAKFDFTPAGGDIREMFEKTDRSNEAKFSSISDK